MSASLTRFRHELSRIWPLLNGIDWMDATFIAEKAYVTAVFSKIAYLEIPEFEVRHHTLAKVIPCLTHQELIARGFRHDVREFLRSLDFGDDNVFVVQTRYLVAVGIATQKVIIIALRGTRPLYVSDWMIDLRVRRTTTYVQTHAQTNEVKFHSGFYITITDCLMQIASEIWKLQKRTNSATTTPVYVVGHSLGGALAAITYAVDGTTFYSRHGYGASRFVMINVHSSFSFGMPRYGDDCAISKLRSPFHTYNDRDPVPELPPKWMGFENVPIEYCAGNGGVLGLMPQHAHLVRGIRYHLIERYIRRLGVTAGVY